MYGCDMVLVYQEIVLEDQEMLP